MLSQCGGNKDIYNHSVWHHWVAVGKVSPIKLLQKTEALQNILFKLEDTWEVPAMLDEEEAAHVAIPKEKCTDPNGAIILN